MNRKPPATTADLRNIRNRKIGRLADLDSNLGKLPDDQIAARYNVGITAVAQRRMELGIPPFRRSRRRLERSQPPPPYVDHPQREESPLHER